MVLVANHRANLTKMAGCVRTVAARAKARGWPRMTDAPKCRWCGCIDWRAIRRDADGQWSCGTLFACRDRCVSALAEQAEQLKAARVQIISFEEQITRTDHTVIDLDTENAALREMLRKHQHADNLPDEEGVFRLYYCPECEELRERGHDADCALAALLQPTTAPVAPPKAAAPKKPGEREPTDKEE